MLKILPQLELECNCSDVITLPLACFLVFFQPLFSNLYSLAMSVRQTMEDVRATVEAPPQSLTCKPPSTRSSALSAPLRSLSVTSV